MHIAIDPAVGGNVASVRARALGAGVSALAGVGVGIATNIVTDSGGWAWALALTVGAIVLVGSQVWLSSTGSSSDVTALGRGSVAAGGLINADIDIKVTGPAGRTSPRPTSGVTAVGDGSVAAGGDIKGRIRSWITKR